MYYGSSDKRFWWATFCKFDIESSTGVTCSRDVCYWTSHDSVTPLDDERADIEFAVALDECISRGDRTDSVDGYLRRPSLRDHRVMCVRTVANFSSDSMANVDRWLVSFSAIWLMGFDMCLSQNPMLKLSPGVSDSPAHAAEFHGKCDDTVPQQQHYLNNATVAYHIPSRHLHTHPLHHLYFLSRLFSTTQCQHWRIYTWPSLSDSPFQNAISASTFPINTLKI